MINLHVEPKTPPILWGNFQVPFGIALDGYVRGAPHFDLSLPRANFNHHEDVEPLATRSTCAQVLFALRQHFYASFQDEWNEPKAEIFVNDCDEDVCTAVFLLQHNFMVDFTMNPRLNRFVSLVDSLDCTAGAYPYPKDMPVLKELAWVFEPYREFRLNGGLDKKNETSYESVITDVTSRIMSHITGCGRSIRLNTKYDVTGKYGQWTTVQEIGAQARTGMFSDGIHHFISSRQRPDGLWNHVIGKMSLFEKGNLLALVQLLNEAEGTLTGDMWGGRDTVIGSPRVAGSKFDPAEIGNRFLTTLV